MARRWCLAAIVVTAALLTGCSGGKSGQAASSNAPGGSKSTSSPQLDTSQCVDVTGANADLLAANDKDAARKAADTLEGYHPPASVKDAIEHFVNTGGAHFDDPDYTKSNKVLDNWVKQVCPT